MIGLKTLLKSSRKDQVEALDLPEDVVLKENARAKRLILRQDRISGQFTLTYPKRISVSQIVSFLNRQETWMNVKRASHEPVIKLGHGSILKILDEEITLIHAGDAPRKQSKIEGNEFLVYGDKDLIGSRAIRFLKKQARQIFTDKAAFYAEKGGLEFSKIRITDTKSCWGSCSSARVLSLSWRLLLAPEYVCDYVIAHEVSHIKHMDHSKEFWDLCEKLEPQTKRAKKWLKQNGHSLHQIQA